MLYLSQLLSLYDGNTKLKWGYLFTINKFGAPISIEVLDELERLYSSGILEKDINGYYHLSDLKSLPIIEMLENSHMFGWRTKYIMTSVDSILAKPFPKVVAAIQQEPDIVLLEELKRTSILHKDFSVDSLFSDFQSIKEIVGDSNVNLVVPASLWIDYLSLQAQQEETND